jgi:SAM-dependent methyltransferase
LRIDQPTPARMYDYFLGGKDNFPADREAAEKVIAALGRELTHSVVWENRLFLQRATRVLAEAGIDQFVDIGTGLPTQGNVHEIAGLVNPKAHVVYVDNDPIVLAHGRALLATDATTKVITADLRQPQDILTNPGLLELIDFSRPVGLLLVAVFHFIRDEEDPVGILTALREKLAPGSYLVLSHLTSDGPDAQALAHTEEVYRRATSPMVFRDRETIAGYFDGFELIEPGLTRPWQWRPDDVPIPEYAYRNHEDEEHPLEIPRTDWLYGGVARLS